VDTERTSTSLFTSPFISLFISLFISPFISLCVMDILGTLLILNKLRDTPLA